MLCQKPTPTGATLDVMAKAWYTALEAIPTSGLERAFVTAMQAQRTAFPLTAAEVLAAWDLLIVEREAETRNAHPALPAPHPGETYEVGPLLGVLRDFCKEHGDPLAGRAWGPTRLVYALAVGRAGGTAYNFRDLLEATEAPDLYTALRQLNVDVPAPQVAPLPPAASGGWQRLGDLLTVAPSEATPPPPATQRAPERGHPHAPDKAPDPDRTRVAPPADQRR
jgi:hypothetical protein